MIIVRHALVMGIVFFALVLYGCTNQAEINTGQECAKAGENLRDSCCVEKNRDSFHPECVGNWTWIADPEPRCLWVCEQSPNSSCSAMSPDSRDECCAQRNVNTSHVKCIGGWKWIPPQKRTEPEKECDFVCGAEMNKCELTGSGRFAVSCGDSVQVPCSRDSDCSSKEIASYCGSKIPNLLNCTNAKYTCEDGYCHACGCSGETIVGASCGTVTPGQQDACCEQRNKDTIHIMCVGQWKYSPTGDPKTECSWKCGVEAPKNCTAEGGTYVFGSGRKCCDGLAPVSCKKPDENGTCAGPICVDTGICANCGDGVCGEGENKCNCPKDCNKITNSCAVLPPGQVDFCCAQKNKESPHSDCAGKWKYVENADPGTECRWVCSANMTGIANPASVFCANNGYKLEIRNDSSGGQFGVCIFPDSSECEEWSFFRGECGWSWDPQKRPQPCICTMEYSPVCGVDNVTYGNACGARCENVTVAYRGECKSRPIDYSCKIASDCEIKNVGNGCGYYPLCVNKNFIPTPPELGSNVCGFPSINSCSCEHNKCVGSLNQTIERNP